MNISRSKVAAQFDFLSWALILIATSPLIGPSHLAYSASSFPCQRAPKDRLAAVQKGEAILFLAPIALKTDHARNEFYFQNGNQLSGKNWLNTDPYCILRTSKPIDKEASVRADATEITNLNADRIWIRPNADAQVYFKTSKHEMIASISCFPKDRALLSSGAGTRPEDLTISDFEQIFGQHLSIGELRKKCDSSRASKKIPHEIPTPLPQKRAGLFSRIQRFFEL